MMGLLEQIAEKGKCCTGCGLCSNVCYVDAIDMKPDRQGFLYPNINEEKCINCGECCRLCPKLNPTFGNYNDPDCYAAWADDDVRAVSSSGGGFLVIGENSS